MVISDSLSFGDIDDLAQSAGMTYPDSPPVDPAKPYRVSAYVKDTTGKGILGATVNLFKADGTTQIDSKQTDTLGRVFFDTPDQTQVVITPTTAGVSPPYAKVTPISITSGIFSYLFTTTWSWAQSTEFTVYPSQVTPPPAVNAGTSSSTLYMIGALALVGLGIYWIFKPGSN